jgi:hypothetical protein
MKIFQHGIAKTMRSHQFSEPLTENFIIFSVGQVDQGSFFGEIIVVVPSVFRHILDTAFVCY